MPVTYARAGAAAVLTIDRPERRNAVDGPTAVELRAGFDRFCADDGARVLVLTGGGDGEAFCAGADLKALETFESRLGDPAGPLGFTRLESPKPTIAAIRGWCLAGGLELALWCDLRLADPAARLGFPERRWGVALIDGGTQRLPRVVGMGRALDLILTGRIVEAEEARSWGLVNEIVDDPLARALEYAEALASFPQETMLADREAALRGFGLPLDAALALEAGSAVRTYAVAVAGAKRFAGGEGRGGAGAGVTAPAMGGSVRRDERLRRLYAAYNARDLEGLMAGLAKEVDWPNALDGTRVRGRDALRAYWREQWASLSPEMEPQTFGERDDGRLAVKLHQTIRDTDGSVLLSGVVCHVYTFDGEQVARMDIEETPEPPTA